MMVHRFPTEERNRIVLLWLDGNSYREISAKTNNASLGAISNIIDEETKKIPDIKELRQLNVTLKKTGSNLTEVLRGTRFLEKLNSLNLPIDGIESCIKLLDKYGEAAGDVLLSGQKLMELELSQGKTYNYILSEAAEKASRLEETTKRVKNLRTEEETVKKSLRDIEQLKAINEKMSNSSLTVQRLDAFIEHNIRLEQLGLTPKATELLASELAKHGIDPQKAATTLSELLAEKKNLETTVTQLRKEKTTFQRDLDASKSWRTRLEESTEGTERANSFP